MLLDPVVKLGLDVDLQTIYDRPLIKVIENRLNQVTSLIPAFAAIRASWLVRFLGPKDDS